MISILGVAFPGGAYGADWKLVPRLSLSESFSDNANLAADNEDRNSDFLTQVAPGLSLHGRGGRATLDFDYSNLQNFSYQGVQSDSNHNSLAATGQLEAWKDIAFIDGSASISQVIENTGQATSNSLAGQNVNRTEARAFSISPSVRHHFGTWVESEGRVRLSSVTTDSTTISNDTTETESLAITSGRRFTQLTWGINAQNTKTRRGSGQGAQKNKSVNGNGTLVLTRQLSLIGNLGYQKRENSGLNSNPTGLTWRGGISAQPGPRTNFRLTYGDEDNKKSFNFEGTHQLSQRTSVSASYSESVQTSQRQLSDNLNFLVFDATSNQFIDVRTGQPFGPNRTFGLQEDTFRQKRFSLSMNGSRQRNTFNLNAFWEERDVEAQNQAQRSIGGSVGLGRRLTPRTSGNVNVAYQTTHLGAENDKRQDQYDATAGLSYQVSKDIHATLSYSFTLRKVNNAATPEDTHENSVTVGLTKSF